MFLGGLTQVHVDLGRPGLVIRQTAADMFAEGETAYLSIDPEHCGLLEPGEAVGTEVATEAPPAPVLTELPTE